MEVTDYINKWLIILDEMRNDNTYKLAWGRAIIEICLEKNIDENSDEIIIYFKEISKKMLKYYWNQIFYFELKQSANNVLNKEPEIVQYTKLLINEYKNIFNTNKPEWFNKAFPSENIELNQKFVHYIENKIPSTLKKDVSWRFQKVIETENIGVYVLDSQKKLIKINKNHVNQLKDFGFILIQLFNYKWSLLLEKYNYSPKICNKIRGSGDEEIKRNSLEPYKKILLLQFGENEIRDFYTNEIIHYTDISIDHVIPWSFIYEDDIWNLVITTKSYNSKKSNILITEEYIKKLIKRNQELLITLENYEDTQIKKYKSELQYSIDNNTVNELYSYFRV